MNQDLKP